VNGLSGFVMREQDGALDTVRRRIVAIYVVRNPDKLRHVRF
jgi:RNA polymerase sigma-70 factor (ECF subfamily)